MFWYLTLMLADARPVGWLQKGVSSTSLSSPIEVPLLRGPATSNRPAVASAVQVSKDSAPLEVLAVIDLAGGYNRIGRETAAALGLTWEFEEVRNDWRRLTSVHEIVIDGLVLRDVHFDVVDEPGMYLSVPTMGGIGAAVLPSLGLVKLVPQRNAKSLVASVGEVVRVSVQPDSSFGWLGETRYGNGLTLRVPGELHWGPVTSDGLFHLRTDWVQSRVARSDKLPQAKPRGDTLAHSVGVGLGGVRLDDTWILEDTSLADPAENFAAALGYDVLYAMDIAVDPAGDRISFAASPQARWKSAEARGAEMALARFQLAEEEAEMSGGQTSGVKEQRVSMGFEKSVREVALGDPGHPAVRDRNLDLADALWRAGRLDEAVPKYLAASQHAGDHCWAHLKLGERRLAWSGALQEKGFVEELVRQPLERAALLWDTWTGLSSTSRTAIRDGQASGKGLQVPQPETCRLSRALWVLTLFRQGDVQAAERELSKYPNDATASYAAGVMKLTTSPEDAMIQLRRAKTSDSADPMLLRLAMLRASALNKVTRRGMEKEVTAIAGTETDIPLTAAMIVFEASVEFGEKGLLPHRLTRVDAQWYPGKVVAAFASHLDLGPWQPQMTWREAGSPEILAMEAASVAVGGDPAAAAKMLVKNKNKHIPDWWTAVALVAYLQKDKAGLDAALNELHLRFPLIPTTNLGLSL